LFKKYLVQSRPSHSVPSVKLLVINKSSPLRSFSVNRVSHPHSLFPLSTPNFSSINKEDDTMNDDDSTDSTTGDETFGNFLPPSSQSLLPFVPQILVPQIVSPTHTTTTSVTVTNPTSSTIHSMLPVNNFSEDSNTSGEYTDYVNNFRKRRKTKDILKVISTMKKKQKFNKCVSKIDLVVIASLIHPVALARRHTR